MKHTSTILINAFFLFLIQTGIGQIEEEQYLLKLGMADSVFSEQLSEMRKFYVQFPINYDPNTKYPVAYILDGEQLLPTANDVQNYYSGGFTPEMILIGISNSENRTRDLTTSKIIEKYGMPFTEENGEAENFIAFLETDLIPYIENKYPVSTFRTLIGHSYGGLLAIYSLIHYPQLFASYLAIDPSLDWDSQKLISEAREKLPLKNYHNKSLFISLSGQLHMQEPDVTIENVMEDTSDFTLFARSNITFAKLVQENESNGLTFNWKFYPRDLHGTVQFPSLMDGLIANFKWFQMEETDKFNSPETSKDELARIINKRANKLESHFGYTVPPYPEELLNALGYMSLDMGYKEKSKMFFEFAIQFYPDSANAYDSMSEYYERNKDYSKALKLATKAYEISGEDYHKQRIRALKENI